MLETVIVVLHILTALGVIAFVLIQHGKGADMGASFGSGASATVFGSQGSANFLSRTTAVLTLIFFCTSVGLAYYAKAKSQSSVFDQTPAAIQQPESQKIIVDQQKPVVSETTSEKVATQDNIAVDFAPAPITQETKQAKKVVDKK